MTGHSGLAETPQTLTIGNDDGFEVTIVALGAAIASLRVPMGNNQREAVLGYPSLAGYQDDTFYMGATVGRYANRIANATVEITDDRVTLDANEGPHCLHGGADGLSRQRWSL
ncbi:MAG: galactose-1-epimerase, partial [Pseudomonadota bacterium]